MALMTIRHSSELGQTYVLAPERYDPRREGLDQKSSRGANVLLNQIASIVRQTVAPKDTAKSARKFVVLDTSDSREGIVFSKKLPTGLSEIGSAKKIFRSGDVIISRLRPYLRQVAYIDDGLGDDGAVELACSTEYFVLRSTTSESIAFLVPFLLSHPVQKVLAASQEGGHHPRFNEEVLLNLPIPQDLIELRSLMSAEVTESIVLYRKSADCIGRLTAGAERLIASMHST